MPLFLWGQNSGQKGLEIGFGLTATAYWGDYTDEATAFSRIYPGGNLALSAAYKRAIGVSVQGGFGKFSDQFDGQGLMTPPGVTPATFVETQFFYGDLQVVWRPFPQAGLSPFLSIGAGFLHFTPRDAEGRKLEAREFTRLTGESYNTAVPQLPGSVGLDLRLNRTVSLGFAYVYRYTPTDYLDNVGGVGQRQGFDALHSVRASVSVRLWRKEASLPISEPEASRGKRIRSKQVDSFNKAENVAANTLVVADICSDQ